MRLGLMATYLGVPYQAGLGPDGTQATLLSSGPPPEDLGFTTSAGHWRKQVSVADLDSLWLSRPVGEYRGEPCLVLEDLGDRLHIAYLGRDTARAVQLGYWEIDREVFEVVVARPDVARLIEERVDFPLTAATFPPPETPMSPPPESAESRAGPAEAGPQDNPGAGHGSRRPERVTAWHGSPGPWTEDEPGPAPRTADEPGPAPRTADEPGPAPRTADEPGPASRTEREPAAEPEPGPAPGRRTGRKDRVSPESVFADLLSLAAIPHAAYAVDEEVPGAMCLVEADGGFEVFGRTDDARLEVQFFEGEEAAYFYLFGVLAAEAVRSGRLAPNRPAYVNGHHHGSGPDGPAGPSGTSPAAPENVSKYLRGRK
jgi:hypothetical protein